MYCKQCKHQIIRTEHYVLVPISDLFNLSPISFQFCSYECLLNYIDQHPTVHKNECDGYMFINGEYYHICSGLLSNEQFIEFEKTRSCHRIN